MKLSSISIAVIALCLSATVDGYPTGAPPWACREMFPAHHAETQETPSPYELLLNQTTYRPLETITFWINSTNSTQTFKGILVIAHRPAPSTDMESLLGEFNVSDSENKLKTGGCYDQNASFVTHKNKDPVSSVQFTWTAPAINVGNVEFVATVVESEKVFWINIKATVTPVDSNSTEPPAVNSPTVSNISSNFDLTGCGTTKGCVVFPNNCINNCNKALTFQRVGQDWEFEIMTSIPEIYLAMALSDDKKMGGDEAIVCLARGTAMTFRHGYNVGRRFFRQFTRGLKKLSVKRANGYMSCKFTRPQQMTMYTDTSTRTYDLSQQYHILLALGELHRGSDVMDCHHDLPVMTVEKVSFNNYRRYPVVEHIHSRYPPKYKPTTVNTNDGNGCEIRKGSLYLVCLMAGLLLSLMIL